MQVDCDTLKDGNKYTFCRKIHQSIEFSVNNRTLPLSKVDLDLSNILFFFLAVPPDTRLIRSCGWDESSYKVRKGLLFFFKKREFWTEDLILLCRASATSVPDLVAARRFAPASRTTATAPRRCRPPWDCCWLPPSPSSFVLNPMACVARLGEVC